jgi:glycosyltransferase involved in cell wall biosynthesis
VATPVDGLGEVLRDGENARLVPPRDGRALADAIAALLDDPSQARRLAACAQADSRRYDVQQTVERMQGIYEELAR